MDRYVDNFATQFTPTIAFYSKAASGFNRFDNFVWKTKNPSLDQIAVCGFSKVRFSKLKKTSRAVSG